MYKKMNPIGVLDSGMGGLTVVRELERLLPDESIVYFGDNANCPYGNGTREDILKLSYKMLDFLKEKGVKTAVIACNTISTLADKLRLRYDFPIISIIEEAVKFTAGRNYPELGIFATEFTIKQGLYETMIRRACPKTKVYGSSSRILAALIEEGRFNDPVTEGEVSSLLNKLLKLNPSIKNIILGCTHYPIIIDLFKKAAPQVNYINPAEVQAKAVKSLLVESCLLNDVSPDSGIKPYLSIYTSGKKEPYITVLKKLMIMRQASLFMAEQG